jgi:hypothetical protein
VPPEAAIIAAARWPCYGLVGSRSVSRGGLVCGFPLLKVCALRSYHAGVGVSVGASVETGRERNFFARQVRNAFRSSGRWFSFWARRS